MNKINRAFKSAIKYLSCLTEKNKKEDKRDKGDKMVFVFQNNDNSIRKLENSTLIDNNGSNLKMSTQNNIEDKVKVLEKNKLLCSYFNGCLIEDLTDLILEIVDDCPELIETVKNKRKTKSIISKLDTLSHVSDKKILINQDFLKYFGDTWYENN